MSRGAKPGGVDPSSAWPHRRFHPRPRGRSGRGIDAAASAESPPTRGSPFAPSDEKQSTPLSPTERVCDGGTSAGRRVRGPRACLAAFGLQPLPAWAWRTRKPGCRPGQPDLLPSRARHAEARTATSSCPDAALRPALAAGPCTSLSGHSAGRGSRQQDHPLLPRHGYARSGPRTGVGQGELVPSRRPTHCCCTPHAFLRRRPRSGSRIPAAARARSRPQPSAPGRATSPSSRPRAARAEREAWLGPAPAAMRPL